MNFINKTATTRGRHKGLIAGIHAVISVSMTGLQLIRFLTSKSAEICQQFDDTSWNTAPVSRICTAELPADSFTPDIGAKDKARCRKVGETSLNRVSVPAGLPVFF